MRSEIDQQAGKLLVSKEYYLTTHVRFLKATFTFYSLKFFGNIVHANTDKQKDNLCGDTPLQVVKENESCTIPKALLKMLVKNIRDMAGN